MIIDCQKINFIFFHSL